MSSWGQRRAEALSHKRSGKTASVVIKYPPADCLCNIEDVWGGMLIHWVSFTAGLCSCIIFKYVGKPYISTVKTGPLMWIVQLFDKYPTLLHPIVSAASLCNLWAGCEVGFILILVSEVQQQQKWKKCSESCKHKLMRSNLSVPQFDPDWNISTTSWIAKKKKKDFVPSVPEMIISDLSCCISFLHFSLKSFIFPIRWVERRWIDSICCGCFMMAEGLIADHYVSGLYILFEISHLQLNLQQTVWH